MKYFIKPRPALVQIKLRFIKLQCLRSRSSNLFEPAVLIRRDLNHVLTQK